MLCIFLLCAFQVHVTGTVYLFDLIPLPLANYSAGSRVTFPVDEKICVGKPVSLLSF